MDKRKLLIGLILFLAITNIVTVLTVVFREKPSDQSGTKATSAEIKEGIPDTQRTLFFTRELKLDAVQQNKFREIHWNYMRKAKMISYDMSLLRDSLLNSMDENQPDSVRLNELSERIGIYHTELKKLTVQYYISLKSICNQEQQIKLYELIKGILKPDGDVQIPRGQGPQGGNGQGRGPWWRDTKDSINTK
jgi:Spy/CpxP family protein refolding chaperone